jgi:gamma-glutamyltranspeptidase/glutathione hydrolase
MAKGPRDAISNHPTAQEAADECLLAGGSAVDAVLAAYFALAGATPWGLLAPVTLLVAGSGTGVRAVDGRARQPGLGVERPVRYNDDASAPIIARASASATPAAISMAASMFGRESLVKLATLGARVARKQGARERAALLTRFGSAKAWVLQDRAFLAELAERVPRFEGALLQPADLAIEGADVLPCEPTLSLAGVRLALPPWHELAAAPSASPSPTPGPSPAAGAPANTDDPASPDAAPGADPASPDAAVGSASLAATPGAPAPRIELAEASPALSAAAAPLAPPSFCFLAMACERGSLAALLLRQPARSVQLFDGEVDLPALGQPVLKGIPRLRPGASLPLSAPLAVFFDGSRLTHIGGTTAEQFSEDELAALLAQGTAMGLTQRAGTILAARLPA